MEKLRDTLNRFFAWHRSRKARKLRRATGAVADTAAAGVGFALRTAVKAVVSVLLIFITTGILFACIFAVYVKTCLTDDLDVSLEEVALALSSTILYKDTNGDWQELATLYANENRVWTDYENIPEDLVHAAVSIEDERFYTHKGVDWYRTVAAFGTMFMSMDNNFGGSTITQQLIKNVTDYDDVTVQRKLLEIFRALEFEKTYTKEEIMTWYLNEIYLGEGCYGVGSAAKIYFGKDVTQLTLAECASLIGITNNPSMYDPYISDDTYAANVKRRNTILWKMYELGYIDFAEYTSAKNEVPHFERAADTERPTVIYSYYVDTVIRDVISDLAEAKGISKKMAEHLLYNGGYKIYSCIDKNVQDVVDWYYEDRSNLPSPYRSGSQPLESAIVIIEPESGDIVALCGGVGQKTTSLSGNHATEWPHQPGSSFKPIAVYAPALDLGVIGDGTMVNDSPNQRLSGTSWYPRNSGNGYSGVISIHTAVVLSRNTIAAQVLDMIGLGTSWNYLTEHFGVESLIRDKEEDGHVVTDFAYAPLALGQLSYGITVREMAQAYTAFVNDGAMSRSRTYSLITDDKDEVVLQNPTKKTVAIKANTARTICSMLQDAVRRGTGTDAYFGSTAVGGKTGTTTDDNDRYFVGFTNYYVCAVWTGHEKLERMYFSGNPAAKIFRNIMTDIHYGLPYSSFKTPTANIDPGDLLMTMTPEPSETPEPTDNPEPVPDDTAPPGPLDPDYDPVPVITAEPAPVDPAPVVPVDPVEPEVPATAPPEPTDAPQPLMDTIPVGGW